MSRRASERGAVALIYALLAVVLLGVAALSVDLGNGIARRSDVQGQADFAALSAAPALGTRASGAVPDGVLDIVRTELNNNRVLNDNGSCRDEAPCVGSNAQLVDGNLANGEARFCSGLNAPASGCRKAGLQVIAPSARVNFGFAGIFGAEAMNVQGSATVALKSPMGPIPLYAVAGCDYGRQTLTDPASGQVTPVVPPLAFPLDDNGAELTSLSVPQVNSNATGVRLTVDASRLDHITRVGFFRETSLLTPNFETVDVEVDAQNSTVPVDTGNAAGTVTVTIPLAVTGVDDVWWVRLYSNDQAANNRREEWSPMLEALPLRVGAAILECTAGSTDGNFGSLSLERTDVTSVNDQLAKNIIDLQLPTSLKANPAAIIAECFPGIESPPITGDVAVITDLPNPGQTPGTNCVSTDTGLPASAATAGFVTGVGGTPGRLRNEPTRAGCSPTGGNGNASLTLQSTTYSINNDTLSCFFTNDTTRIMDITQAGYSGGAVLDPAIFDSPRFFLVPVLAVAPLSGGSNRYWVVDFRPAFLTDEDGLAERDTPTTGTSENGLHVEQNQVKSIKVVFFNFEALPNSSNGAVQDYIGVGDPIIRLVD